MSAESRLQTVQELARLPLYQLSTAGMELFHTNMLYWLAAERLAESAPVWAALGAPRLVASRPPVVARREWHHLDLVIAASGGQAALVVENKIGAIPSPGQLDRYLENLRSTQATFSPDDFAFALLTLTPPAFEPPEPWHSITYRDLLPALRETAANLTGADAALVTGYADLVQRLDELATAYAPAANRDAPFALSPAERNLLLELRLLSLVEKVRTGRFAELLTRSLPAELRAAGEVGTGYTNGSAIYQWFMPGPAGRRFGWQVQHGQFRLAVILGETAPRAPAEQEKLVAELYSPLFNFDVPGDLRPLLGTYAGRKQWLHYAPSFVYRYAPLSPNITWNDLLALAIWFTRRTQAYVMAFS